MTHLSTQLHRLVHDDVDGIVRRALQTGDPVLAGSEAQRIAMENLDSGVTERDIAEYIVRIASANGVSVDVR